MCCVSCPSDFILAKPGDIHVYVGYFTSHPMLLSFPLHVCEGLLGRAYSLHLVRDFMDPNTIDRDLYASKD